MLVVGKIHLLRKLGGSHRSDISLALTCATYSSAPRAVVLPEALNSYLGRTRKQRKEGPPEGGNPDKKHIWSTLARTQLVAKSLVINSLGAFRFLVRRMTVPFLRKTR